MLPNRPDWLSRLNFTFTVPNLHPCPRHGRCYRTFTFGFSPSVRHGVLVLNVLGSESRFGVRCRLRARSLQTLVFLVIGGHETVNDVRDAAQLASMPPACRRVSVLIDICIYRPLSSRPPL
ncbi:hypothetical protein JAAARDRAFT_615868 [Jaapia argillacea MUCL 33604]|uniref:Uncharacterized protein n=1 Tax=Jaapia argillacea MUCL 33604 TaxID=933084 RepID=A0A067PFH6_9AGAM|nr:hypothetical protein JAAARDRAFT_615868 [Jaapia argillacea MUCL 33604]